MYPSSGFSGEAISFQDIVIRIDPASILSREPIVITEVTVRSPSVNLVLGANGSTNIQALLADDSGSSSKPSPSTDTSGGSSSRLRINRLEIADTSLAADLSAVGGKNFSTTIPALRQSNVGGGSGAAPYALATTIAKVYVSKVGESVALAEAEKQVNKLVDKHLGGDAGKAARAGRAGKAGKAGWVGGHQPPKTQKILELPTGNFYFYPSFPNNISNYPLGQLCGECG